MERKTHYRESDENKISQNLLKGTFLAFCSGVLFTINHVFIQQFKLNFVDLALVRFMTQTLALLILITFETTPLTEDQNIIDETKLWVQNVDQDKNLNYIRFILLEAETETVQAGVWHISAGWPGAGCQATHIVWWPSTQEIQTTI